MKKSFILFSDILPAVETLDDADAGVLFKMLLRYNETGEEPSDVPRLLKFPFKSFIAQMKRNEEKYVAISEKRREAAKKKWDKYHDVQDSANGCKCMQTSANAACKGDSDSDSDSVSDSEDISILSDTMNPISSSPIVEEELFKDANASTSSHDDAPLVLTPPEESKGRKKDYSLNVMSFWNNSVKGANVAMPTIAKMTDRRKAVVNARVSEYGINKVYQAISKAVESTFLNGGGSRGFIADFDWVMRPNNFPKVLEGSYSNNGGTAAINMNQDGNVQQPRSREQREADLRNKERLEYLSKKYGDIG